MRRLDGCSLAAWTSCAALLACGGPPAGDRPAGDRAGPAAKAVPATPPAAAAPDAPPRPAGPTTPRPAPPAAAPDDAATMPYPAGLVPAYPGLAGVTFASAAARAPDRPLLARSDECAASPDACEVPVGVLGFHADGRVAVIEAPTLPGCGADVDPLTTWGRVGPEDAFTRAAKRRFAPGEDDPRGARAAADFVAAQARAGFAAPASLVAFTGEEVAGIRAAVTLAGLRAPLSGWMVHAVVEGDAARVRLVDPDNRTAHALGEVAARGAVPSLVQVVLNPARTHLFVTLALNDGEHCGADPVQVHRWPLPAGVPAP